MAKLTLKAISDLQFDVEKVILCENFNEVESARSSLRRWKYQNFGCSYKSRVERQEDKFLLFVTKVKDANENRT